MAQLHIYNATSQGYNIKTLLKERGRRPRYPGLHKRSAVSQIQRNIPRIQHQDSSEGTRPEAALSSASQAQRNFTSTTRHHRGYNIRTLLKERDRRPASVIVDFTSTVQLHMRNAASQGYNIKTPLKERGRRPRHPELHKRITHHKYNAKYQGCNINNCLKERGRSYCSSSETWTQRNFTSTTQHHEDTTSRLF